MEIKTCEQYVLAQLFDQQDENDMLNRELKHRDECIDELTGQMKAIEAPKSIEPWRIICAAQSEPDYSEERYMLVYAGDGINDYYDKGYILLEGWHCSCYDWPEVDWDATYYEEDELLKIADMRKRNPSDSAERRFFMLVEQALGAHQ